MRSRIPHTRLASTAATGVRRIPGSDYLDPDIEATLPLSGKAIRVLPLGRAAEIRNAMRTGLAHGVADGARALAASRRRL